MVKVRWRMDFEATDDWKMKGAWGLRLPNVHEFATDVLVLSYDLLPGPGLPTPVKYMPEVTHEVVAHWVSPETPIDYNCSLWRQKGVCPLAPCAVALQFRADDNGDAVTQVGCMVRRLLAGSALPDLSSHWTAHFRDAVDITHPLLDLAKLKSEFAA